MRAAGVYGYSPVELLSSYRDFNPAYLKNVDLNPGPVAMSFIEVLVGSQRDELKACTLAEAYPRWLTKWVSHLPPRWHTTEYRTVPAEIISPGVCPRCLLEDLANKRSQHLRLSWYALLQPSVRSTSVYWSHAATRPCR